MHGTVDTTHMEVDLLDHSLQEEVLYPGSQFTPINRISDDVSAAVSSPKYLAGSLDIEYEEEHVMMRSSSNLTEVQSGLVMRHRDRAVSHETVIATAERMVERIKIAQHQKSQVEKKAKQASAQMKKEQKQTEQQRKREEIIANKTAALQSGSPKDIAKWTKLEEKDNERLEKAEAREEEKMLKLLKKAAEKKRKRGEVEDVQKEVKKQKKIEHFAGS